MLNPSTHFRVLERGSEDDGKTDWDDDEIGRVESASYALDLGPLPESAISALNEVHRNVISIEIKRFNEVDSLGLEQYGLEGYSGVLVLQGYGLDIPMGKSLGQGMLTALLTMGMVAAWQQSATNYSATLMDPESGEVVWGKPLIPHGRQAQARTD